MVGRCVAVCCVFYGMVVVIVVMCACVFVYVLAEDCEQFIGISFITKYDNCY